MYCVLAVRPVKVTLFLESNNNRVSLLAYTLYLTGSPPVIDGAFQVIISCSHDSDGGVISGAVGEPGTVLYIGILNNHISHLNCMHTV